MADFLDFMFGLFYIESNRLNMEGQMPFREKVAWIALIGIVAAFCTYFGMLLTHRIGGTPSFYIQLFLAVIAAQVVISIVAMIVVAAVNPQEAGAPRDERERRIDRAAAGGAYYPMLVGVILAGASFHLGNGPSGMLNALLAVVMLAEALRFGLQIRGYRRGWHG